jgi:hypothetical protein
MRPSSVNRNFFSQATDEAYALGLVKEGMLRSLFTLNCLFFDSVSVGAADLLGNPVLYKMMMEEREAMLSLYRSPKCGGLGVLQPVIIGDSKSMSQVADLMIQTNTIFRLPDRTDLVRHARAIDDADAMLLSCPESDFRRDYYRNMIKITKYLNTNGLDVWVGADQLFPAGSLAMLEDWLSNEAPTDFLRYSSVHRFAELSLPLALQHKVKLLAESIFQYTISSTQMAALSTARDVTPFVDSIRTLTSQSDNKQAVQLANRRRLRTDGVSVSLPLEDIAKLPLQHLVIVRDLPAFRDVRRILADFRCGRGPVSADRVQQSVDACAEQFLEYVGRSELQREVFVERLRKKERITRLRVWYDVGAAATPVLLTLASPGPLSIALGIVSSATLLGISRYVAENEIGHNTIHPEFTGTRATYLPVEGIIREGEETR